MRGPVGFEYQTSDIMIRGQRTELNKLRNRLDGYSLCVESFEHVNGVSTPGDANLVLRKDDYLQDSKEDREKVAALPIQHLVGSLRYVSQRGSCDILPALTNVAARVSNLSIHCWAS